MAFELPKGISLKAGLHPGRFRESRQQLDQMLPVAVVAENVPPLVAPGAMPPDFDLRPWQTSKGTLGPWHRWVR